MNLSKRLTIFEGCDGTGKSTAAKRYAEATGAVYVHFAALPRVREGLARMYVEAMLPALLGYQDVVFDRCWLSETPYGMAFREGQDRLGDASRRMLERLALRCGAVVVLCDPGWNAVKGSYMKRKHLEMLDDVGQLKQVYEMYMHEPTDLPVVKYDYTMGHGQLSYETVDSNRFPRHPLSLASAGNWSANIVIVGDQFIERKDNDPFYQWPFASFSKSGCSQWLANQLESIEAGEDGLLWVNADQDLTFLTDLNPGRIVAMGDVAYEQLHKMKMANTICCPHPQYFRRFSGGRVRYPLLNIIQE